MTQHTGNVQILPLSHLQPNPMQPRVGMDEEELSELALSIKSHGILEPIVVAHTPAGYQIIAGERRWKAAKLAGLSEVPCVVKETSPKGMLEMAIIENVQRADLPPMDRANAFKRLIDDFKLTVGQIADRVGKSQAYVSNTLRLLQLPDALKDGLLSGAITEGHARALSAIEDVKLMVEAYKIILKESGSVRRAEDLARRMKRKLGKGPTPAIILRRSIYADMIDECQEELEKYFGEKASVRIVQTKNHTRVHLDFKEPPELVRRYLDRLREMTASPLPEFVPDPEPEPSITLSSFSTTEIIVGE